MGLFDIFNGSQSSGFDNPRDIDDERDRGYVRDVPGSGGSTVFDVDTGNEYWTDDGKRKD